MTTTHTGLGVTVGHQHGEPHHHDHGRDRAHDSGPGHAGDAAPLDVEVERRPASQVALTITAAPDDVEAAVASALRRLAGRVRLAGFRPGRAPAPVVERAVGWPAVAAEAVETLVPSVYARALDQVGLRPVADPELDVAEPLERGRPFRFSAVVTVQPEVELGDYRDLRVDEPHTEVDEDEVDRAVEMVRRRHAEVVEVDRPAESGDLLRAVLTMRRGEEILGGADEERDVELDREQLLPGLVDGMLGLAAGQSHPIELTLPADYAREELRGVAVTVEAEVRTVRERRLPPLDDSLAALDGHGETLEELRAHYRERLEEAAAARDLEHFEGEVLERLRDSARVEVPDVMVDREVERQLRDLELRLAQSGLRLDRYLEYAGETLDQARAARRDGARQRVRLELVLEALADAEGVEIDDADVEREERRLIGDQKVTADQRRRVHGAAHRDLLLRAAGQRVLEIARGEG